jgi:hypothetical protein
MTVTIATPLSSTPTKKVHLSSSLPNHFSYLSVTTTCTINHDNDNGGSQTPMKREKTIKKR